MNCLTSEEHKRVPFVGTVSRLLSLAERNYPDAPALRDATSAYTYKELSADLALRRAALKEAGVNKGDVVGVLMKNSVLSAEWMLTILSYGAILVPFPVATDEYHYLSALAKFGIKAMIKESSYTYVTEDKVTIIAPDAKGEKPLSAANLVNADPAMIFFTGGTTGDPKGTLLCHRAIMRGALNGVYLPDGVFGQLFLSVLPFSHVFGFVRCLLTPIYCGSEVYITSPYAFLRNFANVKPTVAVLVPGLADALLKAADEGGEQVLGGRLNKILCGGAAIPHRVSEGFKKYNVRVVTGYGMTETANSISADFTPLDNNNSVGRIYPKQRMRFRNGEVQLQGDNLLTCYYNDPEATKEAFTEDGWFRTGDVGHMDRNGFLHLTGRIKNIILLSNGENVYPEEIEESFSESPLVKDCVAKEDAVNGTPVIALEILPVAEMLTKSYEELYAIYSSMIDTYNMTQPSHKKISKLIVRLIDFERTISMKIKRKRFYEQH